MWNSSGNIIGQTIELVNPGDMHVTGRIDGNSHVVLRSSGGNITVDDRIDGSSVVYLIASTGSITVNGRVDGSSTVILVSLQGTVTLGDRIDGSSSVTAEAGKDISLGDRIDGSSSASFTSTNGDITIKGDNTHGAVNGSGTAMLMAANGSISLNNRVDGSSNVRAFANSDVTIGDRIDGSSRVEMVSNRGLVNIQGRIDGDSMVTLSSGGNINIGDRIDGDSSVTGIASDNITVGNGIAHGQTTVDFAAGGIINIKGSIGYGATVRLLSVAKGITIGGDVDGGGTQLTTWPKGAVAPTVQNGAAWTEAEWATPAALTPAPKRDGYWWENWPQTFGYVAPFRVIPRSVSDLVNAVVGTGTPDKPDQTPVKAIGGGWSFTDASLPFKTAAEVDQVSLLKKGSWQRQDLRNVLQGVNNNFPSPFDPWPEAVTRSSGMFKTYDTLALRQVTHSGGQLPASPSNVRLIDTTWLASSLQSQFSSFRVPIRPSHQPPEILFHVEAGITMGDLQQLLDHQHPPLTLRSTGASSGATLAGSLSTATHGGEFNAPLLVDSVRAVHLVGPGGEEWWIEGNVPVADQVKLQAIYPNIDPTHFIASGWSGIPGLNSQDVLNAVVVSMGTMGVIYSMVIVVVPQFGIRQVVHPTTWPELLTAAGTTVNALRANEAAANLAILNTLMDGTVNGTGIPKANNEYIDLAINPLNLDCWVVNREITPSLPIDPNNASAGIGDYMTGISRALQQHAQDGVQGNMAAGRVFDFLSLGTDIYNVLANDFNAISALLGYVTASGNPLGTGMGVGSAQAIINKVNQSGNPDRGLQFLADLLSGLLHTLEGTERGQNSDNTAVSNAAGVISWPAGGIAGRGLEIALPAEHAFTFLQTVLFDDVLANTIIAANQPILGYISIRVCPQTNSLLGMPQYGPFSVMIEVVAYRSPQSNNVMDTIQKKALAWQVFRPLLHWGLENDQVNHAYLVQTSLGAPYKAGRTRLETFSLIREFLRNGHPPVFDNAFSARMGI